MAVTAFWYAKAFISLADAEIDYLADTMRVALATSDYTPDQDAHDYFDDVTNEVTGTGYVADGDQLTTPVNTNTLNVVKFDADDTSWTTSTITARYAIVYKDTGTPSDSPLMCWVDFGADVSSSAGTFQITWDAAGIMTVTPADA